MGREGGEILFGFACVEERTVGRARKRALLRSVWESDSDIVFFVINKHTGRLWGNPAAIAVGHVDLPVAMAAVADDLHAKDVRLKTGPGPI